MIQTSQKAYEGFHLGKLLEQHQIPEQCTGAIVFASRYDEDRLDWARWFFSDQDRKRFRESGFKIHMMEWLDLLIRDRCRQGLTEARGGVVQINAPSTGIGWVQDSAVAQLTDLDTLEQALIKTGNHNDPDQQ